MHLHHILLQPLQPIHNSRFPILPRHSLTHLSCKECANETFAIARTDNPNRLITPYTSSRNATEATSPTHTHPTAATTPGHYNVIILWIK